MREWVKVLAGSLALMIGASAPPLIIECANGHLFPPASPTTYAQHNNQAQTERGNPNNQGGESKPLFAGITLLDMATLILAGSTVGLWIVTGRSVRIAERALTEVERPYVFVFNVRWETAPELNRIPRPDIIFNVANYGKTPAVIISIKSFAVFAKTIPLDLRSKHASFQLLTSPILQSGEIRSSLHEGYPFDPARAADPFARPVDRIIVEREDGNDRYQSVPNLSEDEELFFRIVIEYRGAFSRDHQSAFCWRFDKVDLVFAQHGGAEYNYLK
jgi:hypothetical protein